METQADHTAELRDTTEPLSSLPQGELLLATLVGFDTAGLPLLRFGLKGELHTVSATPTVSVHHEHLGRQAALMFAGGEVQAPILLGLVHSALDTTLEQPVAGPVRSDDLEDVALFPPMQNTERALEAEVDGKRQVIEADQQLVLRCGEASITLTKAGRIILRGKHLVSRSSGVNRILGGSIQMN